MAMPVEEHGAPPGIDLHTLHERCAGRLIIDPDTTWASNCYVGQAKVEFGEDVASRLKLSADGTKVLWPQPTDSPLDPQNWNPRCKALQLFIITLASVFQCTARPKLNGSTAPYIVRCDTSQSHATHSDQNRHIDVNVSSLS
ncbi:hypothetical protein B0H14DRAFT_2630057 [Mycena olivaceomarginata]|nr:hypothetical protein B0H14DRAFT_2630057 [Mycena olivaceomarginata]